MGILSVCPSVSLSVCLSVTRVNCDKTVERYVQIYTPRKNHLAYSFPRIRTVAGGATPST